VALLTLTLGQLVDRTIFDLVDPGGQGRRVVMGSTALSTTGATELTLADATGVNPTDVIEFGSELVLVTAKSDLATPVFTVSRGYYNTTAATYAAGQVGHVNPTYPRRKIAEAIRRSFGRLEALGVPLIKSVTVSTEDLDDVAQYFVEAPADCREVLDVIWQASDGRFWHLDGWEFFDYLPTARSSTGKAINLGRYLSEDDEVEIIYRAPYRWSTYPSDPTEASTVTIPEGAEDLPALYAAAWLASSREISRSEIDRSDEWQKAAMAERGMSGALVRAKWQEFYRALDEARRLNPTPQNIVYRRRPRF
jgi:hypothetical protein